MIQQHDLPLTELMTLLWRRLIDDVTIRRRVEVGLHSRTAWCGPIIGNVTLRKRIGIFTDCDAAIETPFCLRVWSWRGLELRNVCCPVTIRGKRSVSKSRSRSRLMSTRAKNSGRTRAVRRQHFPRWKNLTCYRSFRCHANMIVKHERSIEYSA